MRTLAWMYILTRACKIKRTHRVLLQTGMGLVPVVKPLYQCIGVSFALRAILFALL